jgi:SAM-dependent methyltransferase
VVVSDRVARRTPAELVWHDLECGGYRADLPLWHELADASGGRVLDVGAGSGRVTLELARAGYPVTALDCNDILLRALRERAAGLDIETIGGDARAFALEQRDFALCVVPMQTIQLLGGAAQRIAFLRCAREHLRPGAAIALAILAELDPFDCSSGGLGPTAERASVEGLLYLSRAIRVSETTDLVQIERERRVLLVDTGGAVRPVGSPAGDRADRRDASDEQVAAELQGRGPELDVIELDRVSASSLRREAAEAGLGAETTREIAATDEHVGSSVVMLRV